MKHYMRPMRYSMKSMNHRNHQRWLNRFCRYTNKNIEDDELWLGRFYVTQNRTFIEKFEDKSGMLIHAELVMHDRKTGITRTEWYDGLDMGWRFWCDFNDFIIEDCKVWEEIPDVRMNKIDYRKGKQYV